jgi:hypothetical protein
MLTWRAGRPVQEKSSVEKWRCEKTRIKYPAHPTSVWNVPHCISGVLKNCTSLNLYRPFLSYTRYKYDTLNKLGTNPSGLLWHRSGRPSSRYWGWGRGVSYRTSFLPKNRSGSGGCWSAGTFPDFLLHHMTTANALRCRFLWKKNYLSCIFFP